jgi:hypothetical protein
MEVYANRGDVISYEPLSPDITSHATGDFPSIAHQTAGRHHPDLPRDLPPHRAAY